MNFAEAVLTRCFVPMEASGRHVHLTEEHAMALFGHTLTRERDLSQPGQYVCRERVSIAGPKGRFDRVAVLGPERKDSQVEVSLTDARALGVDAPVRLSGDIAGSPGITLEGPAGSLTLRAGVIVAMRHLHLTPEDAAFFGVRNGETVRVRCFTNRPLILEGVSVRVDGSFCRALHMDYDEANACGFQKGDLGLIQHD